MSKMHLVFGGRLRPSARSMMPKCASWSRICTGCSSRKRRP